MPDQAEAMRESDKLTIIISNYNQETHIAETIDSVLAQRVNFSFLVLVADDCSMKDRSREIILGYVKKYSFIRPLFAEENGGYLRNILRAKEKAKTKYLCLLDADDYWTDRDFLQRAYDFLETHDEYTIYESNVEVLTEDGKTGSPFISHRCKSGTYSREMLLNGETVPITQTTGMFLRNCIFCKGIPEIMANAVGTRSERSFEGDTGRFMMHLREGLAYYDSRIIGVYRLTEDGIWNSLRRSQKMIISARLYADFYQYYGSDVAFFVSRAYKYLQAYLAEKQKELRSLNKKTEFIDEYERLMFNDVYGFCKQYENEIAAEKHSIKEKVKKILKIIRE